MRYLAWVLLAGVASGAACASGTTTASTFTNDETDAATTSSGQGASTSHASSPSASSSARGATTGSGGDETGGAGGAGGAGGGEAGGPASSSSTGTTMAKTCQPGEVATGLVGGGLTCVSIDSRAQAAINADCSIYAGWSDGCDACTSVTKWGRASGTTCENGAGADDTCSTFTLGGDAVTTFGLSPDGDVDNGDKFFTGLHCGAGTTTATPGPCAADQLVTGISGGAVTCTSASAAILSYVGKSCWLYQGISDGCGGCTSPPLKWGFSNDAACQNGAGTDDTCSTAILSGVTVRLFGLNTDGDVDDNDKYFIGLRCDEPTPITTTQAAACPAGQFVTGIDAGGALTCTSIAPLVAAYFRAHCATYFGWQDSCDGCVTAPSKWGWAKDGDCLNGLGAGGTCATATLGGNALKLFGLNFGGDVDGNDKLHYGFVCK